MVTENKVQRIEIVFPAPVSISKDSEKLIVDAIDTVCKENCPKNMVMWLTGVGCKPTYISLTQYEEQFRGMEFDHSVRYFEVACRDAHPGENN